MRIALPSLVLAVLMVAGLTGCDFSEQNIDWVPGDSLRIFGPLDAEGGDIQVAATDAGDPILYTPTTAYFRISGFTIDKTYTWTINDQPAADVEGTAIQNDGEFLRIDFDETGTYTIGVTDGTYSGATTVMVTEAPAE